MTIDNIKKTKEININKIFSDIKEYIKKTIDKTFMKIILIILLIMAASTVINQAGYYIILKFFLK